MAAAFGWLENNAVLVALAWMLIANACALGPSRFKVAALVAMLITAPLIIVAVYRSSGLIIAFPVAVLMCLQMRWALYFIRRLMFGDPDAG